MKFIRYKATRLQKISISLLLIFSYELVFPIAAWALTGGPSQPEVQSFEPVGTTDMVDLFSGDFNYNIPLLDVEGYPINISYHSGIGMDQEASWVGLGWNINPGTINRSMRGLPDDFKGDEVKQQFDTKPSESYGFGVNFNFELFGKKLDLPVSLGIKMDNYRGIGFTAGLNPNVLLRQEFDKDARYSSTYFGQDKIMGGLGLSFDSQNGANVDVNYSTIHEYSKQEMMAGAPASTKKGSASLGFSSRSGLRGLTIQKSMMRGSFLETSSNAYLPSAKTPMYSLSYTMSLSNGVQWPGWFTSFSLNGFYSLQQYGNGLYAKNAYGSLYMSDPSEDNFLLDYNRYNDHQVAPHTRNLSVSGITYDYFSVSGQGIGGSFRVKPGYIPITYDDEVISQSTSPSLSLQLGGGSFAKIGSDISLAYTRTRDGVNGLSDAEGKHLSLSHNTNEISPDFEHTYFKELGELTPVDEDYFDAIHGENAEDLNSFLDGRKGLIVRKHREKRNQNFQYLTAGESMATPGVTLDYYIGSYNLNSLVHVYNSSSPGITNFTRDREPNHHISEITVLGDDGRRYVYGIPALNTYQEDNTFTKVTGSSATGLSSYSTSGGGSIIDYGINDEQIKYSYFKQELPQYAHSYLLSGLLSPDYVDISQNGITDDDYGTAVKFNYTRVDDHYHWRTPYNTNSASYQEGSKSDPYDDRGSFIYGEKELWYTHSIETKNFIALFMLSERNDGLGVLGRHGGKNTADRSMKLDSIMLFSKVDVKQNGTSAIPIKTVHFSYDYSLCKHIDNATDTSVGKLTLKSIYFTYGKSHKGRQTKYVFHYDNKNPTYAINSYDRWGNYKDQSENPGGLSNTEYPYINQASTQNDANAAAWTLSKIELPSGGEINITYESDDYAYVQDKRAMEMTRISGIGNSTNFDSTSHSVYTKNHDEYNYLYFPVRSGMHSSNYFSSGQKLFFNFYCRVNPTEGGYENISGYVDVDEVGTCGNNANFGYLKIKKEKVRDHGSSDVPGIAKEMYDYCIAVLPFLIYKGQKPQSSASDAIKGLFASMGEIKNTFYSFYKTMAKKGFCNDIFFGRSYVRLQNPDGFKKGGGIRVKSIEVSDNWTDMQEDPSSHTQLGSYGQTYSYLTENPDNPLELISSGVASYEPQIGGEENPFKQPIYSIHKRFLAKDEKTMEMGPIGESYFPGASVGYSKVTVESLAGKTGKTVTEFYTAKDFPTVVKSSKIDIKTSMGDLASNTKGALIKTGKALAKMALKMVKKISGFEADYDWLRAYQGYSIINNDMHGKMKSQTVYSANAAVKSRVEYFYKSNGNVLDNNVLTYDFYTNEVKEQVVGSDIDISLDKKAESTLVLEGNVQLNMDIVPGIPPAFLLTVPSVWPGGTVAKTDFTAKVITKIFNYHGILEKTVAYEDGSKIETKNLLFDANTGAVLLTETQNEYNDHIYNFTYPAYAAYDGMGQAYKNYRAKFNYVTISGGAPIIKNAKYSGVKTTDMLACLSAGDELIIESLTPDNYPDKKTGVNWLKDYYGFQSGSSLSRGWVNQVNGKKLIIDNAGHLFTGVDYANITIVRSGRRNMQGMPIGSIVTTANPLQKISGVWYLNLSANTTYSNILNAGASIFSEQWQALCDYKDKNVCDSVTNRAKQVKRWLYSIVTNNKTTSNATMDSTWLPVGFSQNELCGSGSNASSYTYSDSDPGTEDLDYTFKDGSGSICSYIHLSGEMQECSTISVSRFVTSLKNCPGTITIGGITYDTSDPDYFIEGYPKYYYYRELGSLIPHLSMRQIFVAPNGHPIKCNDPQVDSIVNVSTTYHCDDTTSDNFNLVLNTGATSESYCLSFITSAMYSVLTGPDVLYKYQYLEDSLTCESFGFTDLVSMDTTTFKMSGDCNGDFEFWGTLASGKKLLIKGHLYQAGEGDGCTTHLPLFQNCCTTCMADDGMDVINPYLKGARGIWRKKADYVYHAKRTQSIDSYSLKKPNLKTDGVFSTFSPFWYFNSTAGMFEQTNNEKWIATSQITSYNPYGNEIENKDALGIFSSALFGYNYKLPIAMAKNAKYAQIAYDGFEDYGTRSSNPGDCPGSHWDFLFNLVTGQLDNATQPHSGKYSLKLSAGDTQLVVRKVISCTDSNQYSGDQFINNACNCISRFSPDTGYYLIGGWMRENHGDTQSIQNNYVNGCIKVRVRKNCLDTGITYTFRPDGPVIESWQRIEGKFSLPAGYTLVEVLLNASSSRVTNFDDLRIHPWNANLKSYAFDEVTLKLMAELDENNYATFYEYDPEGQLNRVKKETIKGIVTLKEVRMSMHKNP